MQHPIADMLAISRKAWIEAKASGNKEAAADALRLMTRAMVTPGADKFFQALSSADISGNDPDVEHNGIGPIDPENPNDAEGEEEPVDEDSYAANPVDEGIVRHDGDEDGVPDYKDIDPNDPNVASLEIARACKNLND